MKVTQERIRHMLEISQERANRINDVVNEADDLRELEDEAMTIAALMYAVNLAKLTKLDLSDFLQLSVATYTSTQVSLKKPKQVN